MAQSPRSTVSSDLYPPSEPEQLQSNLDPGNSLSVGPNVPLQDEDAEREGSSYSDTMQGLDSAGEDASRPSTAVMATSLERTSVTSQKRKRDDDSLLIHKPEDKPVLNPQEIRGPMEPFTTNSVSMSSTPQADSSASNQASRAKRPKANGVTHGLGKGIDALPAAIWQHIFCFVPPVFLGRLLRVNKALNSYLTRDLSAANTAFLTQGVRQPINAEAIWVASRRRFASGLPRPLHGLGELTMWRLLVGRNCQLCGLNEDTNVASRTDNLGGTGPGKTGVRIIWPFGVRCCGSCLQNISKKEYELYLSSCPYFLTPAIPFAFISNENEYISQAFLKNQASAATIQMTKYFYKPGIEAILHRFEEVKSLGTAPADEWIKGLSQEGQERLDDVVRWEQWESRGGLKKVNSRHHPKSLQVGPGYNQAKNFVIQDESPSGRSTPRSMASSTKIEPGRFSTTIKPLTEPAFAVTSAADIATPQFPWGPNTSGIKHTVPTQTYHSRPERNIKDANEAKAARRVEIERRCAALDPPLLPNVLCHMESFQAAMHITQPMTEQAWQILKPRLLAQLPYAERKEKERRQQDELLAEETTQRQQPEDLLGQTKESFDREWETYQKPIRNRLSALADEFIKSNWAAGRAVNKETSPKFAADVLLHVRHRFYAEINQEHTSNTATGEPVKIDSTSQFSTRKLVLENMKWLFDTKVKPLTDHIQRELFLCNGCDGNFKFYGFEGVIQHYAAKHTTTLSMGNIVVHWRAEWPEHPPFNPNPGTAKTAHSSVSAPANSLQASPANDSLEPTSYRNYNQTPETEPAPLLRGHRNSQYPLDTSMATHAGARNEVFVTQTSGLSYPVSASHEGNAGYQGDLNGYASNAPGYNSDPLVSQVQVPQAYSSSYSAQQPFTGFTQAHVPPNPVSYFQPAPGMTYGNGWPQPYQPSFPNGGLANPMPSIPGQISDLYQRQMDEMARHAKEIFSGIGGVKDLPGSVRVHVVVQLTVSRFKATFPNEPSLSMFIDGLDHNAIMRPVRSVNGLGCKTCIHNGTGAKLFTLPHLVNHFRTVHLESPQTLGYPPVPDLDWKTDMIDLPDTSVVSNLINAAGMTDAKLALIASVFPGCFPSPLPSLRGRMITGAFPAFGKDVDRDTSNPSKLTGKNMSDGINQLHASSKVQSFGQPPSNDTPSEPLEPPREDEYDPHRPALLNKGAKVEPSFAQPHQSALHASVQPHYEVGQQRSQGRTGSDQLYSNGVAQQSHFTENISHRPYEPGETADLPLSRSSLMSNPKTRGFMQVNKEAVQKHQRDNAVHEIPPGHRKVYCPTPEGRTSSSKHRYSNQEIRDASPPEAATAADRFLSSLEPISDTARSHGSLLARRETEEHSGVTFSEESRAAHQQEQLGKDGPYDQLPMRKVDHGVSGPDMHTQEFPRDSSNFQPDIPRSVLQRPGSRDQYFEGYYSTSHAQQPLEISRVEQSPAIRYQFQQNEVPGEQVRNSGVPRPRSGPYTYETAHGLQQGARSRSSQEALSNMARYRPRSPVEEDRGDSINRMGSPHVRRLPQDHSDKVMNYGHSRHAGYEYIDERDLPKAQYQPRVEYIRVPIEYEDAKREPPARYYVSRPIEQSEPQYLRYEQAYINGQTEPIYERNGQFYQTSYRAPQGFAAGAGSGLSQDYEYP